MVLLPTATATVSTMDVAHHSVYKEGCLQLIIQLFRYQPIRPPLENFEVQLSSVSDDKP